MAAWRHAMTVLQPFIAEAGLAALCLGLLAAVAMAGCGLLACRPHAAPDVSAAKRITLLCSGLIGFSFLALAGSYLLSDFSVANVYENSHTAKPLLYKFTGTWGNHEGSMLLWVGILAGLASAYGTAPARDKAEKTAALGMLGVIIAGFALFILLTSNPFLRLDPPPMEGRDLNPLLQDIGLALHPPLLYLGYVGFAVVFALAVAALATGRPIDGAWARQVRPWALLAWSFLTAGIGLGSWWAYRELGWGGWWFWDPVENVSLLPWLSGTALLHCLLVLARRPLLQNWTLLLAIFTFTFSLLGTFLVRSGLLTSVHSFASDPTRGMYILLFVSLVVGGSLWLYALRYPRPSAPDFLPVSREGGIMLNNLLLATLCVTVLLGIVYPLLMQVMKLPSVSVGAPFYNTVVVPVAVPLLLAAGLTPLLAWKRSGWKASRRLLRHAAVVLVLLGIAAALLFHEELPALFRMPMAVLVALAGLWMLAATVAYGRRRLRAAGRIALPDAGMLLAHAGLAVFAIAAAFASAGRVETERRIVPGQTLSMAGYEAQLAELAVTQRDNYIRKRATLHLTAQDGSESLTLYPETRFYPARGMETSESSLRNGLRRDVYTAIATAADLGDSKEQQDAAVILRVYVLPAMWWLWAGFAAAALGGFAAASGYFRLLIKNETEMDEAE